MINLKSSSVVLKHKSLIKLNAETITMLYRTLRMLELRNTGCKTDPRINIIHPHINNLILVADYKIKKP